MLKKYLAVTVLLILVCSISLGLIANAQTGTILKLTPSSISTQGLSIGSTFDVTLRIENVVNLWQWWCTLSWDPAVLTIPANMVEGPFLKSIGTTLYITSPKVMINSGILNQTTCTLFSLNGASGNGDLATVTFKVVGYGSTTINFDSAALGGVPPDVNSESPPLSFTSVGCTFSLLDPNQPTSSPTPSPQPTSLPTPSPQPSSTTTPSPTGSKGPTANFSPANGTYFNSGAAVTLDASQSIPGFDTIGKNESCPITNYSWRVEYLNGTNLKSLSGKITNFTIPKEGPLRIILIVTATDPTLPSSNDFIEADSKTAIISVQSTTVASKIDVYLNKGGIGQKIPSSAYGPQELVSISALVTFNDSPVANKDVVFTVYNANNSATLVRVGRTTSTGLAMIEFRLPWPDTIIPENLFGKWSVAASVDISQISVNDTVTFEYNYIINAAKIQIPQIVHRLDSFPVNITLSNINNQPLPITLALTIYDSQKVPVASLLVDKPSLNTGNITLTQNITIPSWALLGQATVYVNVLTAAPEYGGLPYCREILSAFQIQ